MAYIASDSAYTAGTGIVVDTFTAGADFTAGTTSTLTLSIAPAGENSVWVFFNGIAQHQTQYTINNLVISFSEAIPTNVSEISVQINTQLAVGVPGEATVDYGKLTSGAVTSLQRKNAIINGNFDIWQRGTSHSTTGYGSADRWKVWYTGTGTTLTVSQQAFALGQTLVPNEPESFCRNTFAEGTGTTSLVQFYQRIEDVRTFAGETITISFWAKASASLNLGLVLQQFFGTGGSPSTSVSSEQELTSLTTSWAKYEVTFNVPSISGKTLGTDGNDALDILFWFSGGSAHTGAGNPGLQTGTIDISQVQVEKGTTATDFERRHIADELALCQRYYQTYENPHMVGVVGSASVVNRCGMTYPKMRTTPSGTISNTGTVYVYDGTTTEAITSWGTIYNENGSVEVEVTCSAGTMVAGGAAIMYLEQASGTVTLELDAEL